MVIRRSPIDEFFDVNTPFAPLQALGFFHLYQDYILKKVINKLDKLQLLLMSNSYSLSDIGNVRKELLIEVRDLVVNAGPDSVKEIDKIIKQIFE